MRHQYHIFPHQPNHHKIHRLRYLDIHYHLDKHEDIRFLTRNKKPCWRGHKPRIKRKTSPIWVGLMSLYSVVQCFFFRVICKGYPFTFFWKTNLTTMGSFLPCRCYFQCSFRLGSQKVSHICPQMRKNHIFHRTLIYEEISQYMRRKNLDQMPMYIWLFN